MAHPQRLTLTKRVLAVTWLSAWLASCSLIPGVSEPTEERLAGTQALPQQDGRLSAPSLQALADQARAAKAQVGKSAAAPAGGQVAAPTGSPTLQKIDGSKVLAQKSQTLDAPAERLARMRAPQGETQQDRRADGLKSPAERQAAALALLSRAKSRASAPPDASIDAVRLDEGRPKTYRLDGPAPVAANNPYANPYQQQPGPAAAPVASYPRHASAAFSPPPYAGQGSPFQPPDPAPEAARPANDPKALMEAVERLRSRQVVQPARVEASQSEATGSVQAPVSPDFTPATALTFIQFDKGSSVPSAAAQKQVASLVQPFIKQKGAKLVMAVGLGGEGEAYVRLLHANQRAQAVSQLMPPGFEIVRRFDPALPNESVRMFVVKSEK